MDLLRFSPLSVGYDGPIEVSIRFLVRVEPSRVSTGQDWDRNLMNDGSGVKDKFFKMLVVSQHQRAQFSFKSSLKEIMTTMPSGFT